MSTDSPIAQGDSHEIHSVRILAAPRERVYGAFAEPNVLAQWWGPKGFTSSFSVFELRQGGAWRFEMQGPDGARYPMVHDFLEVTPLERISFRHTQPGHDFVMTITFVDAGGGTRLSWQMRFDSESEAARVRAFVLEANEQNFDRLEAQLAMTAETHDA